MGGLIGVLVAGFFIWLLIAYPGFRNFVLVGIALVAAAIFFWWQDGERTREKAKTLISASELELRNLQLSSPYGILKIIGTIKNKSQKYTLTRLTLRIRAHNCHGVKTVPHRDCEIIGETTQTRYGDIPPDQVRALEEHVSFSKMPAVKDWTWSYEITGIEAKP